MPKKVTDLGLCDWARAVNTAVESSRRQLRRATGEGHERRQRDRVRRESERDRERDGGRERVGERERERDREREGARDYCWRL